VKAWKQNYRNLELAATSIRGRPFPLGILEVALGLESAVRASQSQLRFRRGAFQPLLGAIAGTLPRVDLFPIGCAVFPIPLPELFGIGGSGSALVFTVVSIVLFAIGAPIFLLRSLCLFRMSRSVIARGLPRRLAPYATIGLINGGAVPTMAGASEMDQLQQLVVTLRVLAQQHARRGNAGTGIIGASRFVCGNGSKVYRSLNFSGLAA
jgi:hypothetical protein